MADKYLIAGKESENIGILRSWFTIMIVCIHADKIGVMYSGGISGHITDMLAADFRFLLAQIICRCGVPMFFLLASILLYRKEIKWKENFEKKIRTIMVPFLLANLFWIIFYGVAQRIGGLRPYFSNEEMLIERWGFMQWIDAFIGLDDFPMLYPTWFLRDLFILNILSVWIKKIIDRFPKTVGILLVIVWMLGIMPQRQVFLSGGIIFWVLGYYLVKYNIHLSDIKYIPLSGLLIVYCFSIGSRFIFTGENMSRITYNFAILTGSLFWIKLAVSIKKERNRIFWVRLSEYSFFVYLFHEMTVTIILKLFEKVVPSGAIGEIISYMGAIVLVLGISIWGAMLLKKIFPGIYTILVGGRSA